MTRRVENWDPAQYGKFAAERMRPVEDLLARLTITAPATVYDLGCGDGSFLIALAARFPERHFLGVERLLGRARKVARKRAKELASTVRSVDVASHRDDLVEQARDLAARAADLGRDLGRTAADRLSDVDIPKVSKARRFPKLNLAR